MTDQEFKSTALMIKMRGPEKTISLQDAKRCAIVLVDEVLDNIKATMLYHKDSLSLPINLEYWNEVRDIINKY